jgi:hypothetical protein
MTMAVWPLCGHIVMIMNVMRGAYDRGGSSAAVLRKSTGQISFLADAGARAGNLPCVL